MSERFETGGECPVLATERVIAGKWTLLVLRDLAGRPRRFTELERSLGGISPRTLSQRLRALEEDGVVDRQVFMESPYRVEYSLTAKGRELLPIVEAMRTWGSRWGGDGSAPLAPAPLVARDRPPSTTDTGATANGHQ